MTSILGWSRLLRSNQLSETDRDRAIQIIQRNAEAQAKLIEDLLEVSRIITGKLRIEFQPVTFASIVDAVINSLRPAADAKRLQLETAIDPTAGPILGDPARLQQIVTNVLSNAIKFTGDVGRVELFSAPARLMLENSETFSEQRLKDLRILVVEDDADTRELLKTILERCGAEVRTVGSSDAAMAEIAKRIPDILISDIGMPGES